MCACACVCTRQSRLQQLVDLHRAEIHEIQSQAEVFGTFRLPILSLYFVQNCHQLVVKQHVHPGVDMSPSGRRPPRPHNRGIVDPEQAISQQGMHGLCVCARVFVCVRECVNIRFWG